MKNHIITLACSLCFLILINETDAQTPVTFNVNMLAMGMSDNLHVVGNFADPNYDNVIENPDYQNWTPNASSGLMTDDDMDLVYTVTLMLQPGRYEFKFVNGIDWPNAETVPATCTVEVNGNSNRQIMVGSSATSYSVCYGECADCGDNAIRLRVDMSTVDLDADGIGGELGEDIHPDGVFVNGSYASWMVFTPLQDWNGDNIWEGLITTYSADPIEFKFINGPGWDFPSESVLGSCGLGNSNRYLLINETNTVLPVYCWSSCDPCTQPAAVTFQVDMNSACEDTSPGIYLMGTLTDWANGAPMSDTDGDGIWTLTLQLNTGYYDFKYRIGDSGWEGIGVRQLTVVADTPLNLPVVCFNSSQACNPLVAPSTVTFNVDVSNIPMSNGEVLWVMGDFTSPAWQSGAIQMSDTNGDDIWSVTVPNVCPTYLNYKYRIGYPQGSFFTEEDANFSAIGGCGVDNGGFSDNRFLERTSASPINICNSFNSCQVCALQSIPGCTDPTACNYNPAATSNDGSCNYDCPPCNPGNGVDLIWADDFSDAQNWIIAHDGTFNSDFEIGIGLESVGAYGTPAILSSTAFNGYALYNSDGFNNQAGVAYEQAHITMASPIDLSGFENVIIQFETQYRSFTDEQTWLIVSTDGTFPTLDDPMMDISSLPGVFRVWENGELTQSVSPGNPTIRSFNISEIAGGASQVWVRFQFTGIWGYAWYIDDVQIRQQFDYDAELVSARFEYPNTGIEFGRIPASQLPDNLTLNCELNNAGSLPLNNLTLNASIVETSSNTVFFNENVAFYPTLASGQSINFLENIVLNSIPIGNYEVRFSLSSTEQTCDGNTTNNSETKYVRVTSDLFALDSEALYATEETVTGSIGTNSFTDNSDEFMAMNYYPIGTASNVSGIEVLLAQSTVAGGELYVSIHDTLDIFSDIIDNPYTVSNLYTITENDIANGFAFVPFDSPALITPNGYYAAATLFSSGGTYPVRIVDSFTIDQPASASMIYLPSDGVVYSNGNAFGIRMKFGNSSQIAGCTSQNACNYNPDATIENGSCLYVGNVCNDGNSSTVNDVIQSNCSCFGTLVSNTCNANEYNFGNAEFGIYPDTSAALINGCINEPYYQPFFILVPSDAGAIDPTYAGVAITSMEVNGFTIGSSPVSNYGLTYTCSTSNCLLEPGNQYCLNLFGTPNQSGTFDVILNVTFNMNFFGMPIAVPFATSPYILDVSSNCSSPISGCTNSTACNFNPDATVSDGSCLIVGSACNDSNPNTINDSVQNNCECAGAPIDPGCSGFNVSNNTFNPTCAGVQNGFISVSASGTSAPFNYTWSNGANSSTVNNIGTGAYSVIITDALGCSETLNFTISAPTALNATTSTNAVSCFGAATGTASVSVTGGTAPYSYAWNTSPIQNTSQISNVAAGNYTVNVTDANGCIYSIGATITQPSVALSVTASTTSATCSQNDGSASAFVSGNTGNIQYSWSNGQAGATATNLSAGTYTVTVNSGGCSTQTTVSVNNTNAPIINQASSSPDCFGANTGSINTIVTGGNQPYQYLWSNGTSGTSQTGLAAGNYTFIVIDNAGCQASAVITLTQPDPINISLATAPTSCSGTPQGSVNATVSGGTQPYQYNWSNGSGGTVINNLSAGQYSLNIIDGNGCTANANAQVISPNGVVAFALAEDANCIGGADGSLEIIVTDGNPPYAYEWSNGATGAAAITNLIAGEYSCIITDATGCTFNISEMIEEPSGNLPEIIGFNIVDPFSIQTYSTSPIDGANYSWLVVGGNILNGQGSNFIQVQWSDDTPASIELIITNPNGCVGTLVLDIQIGTSINETLSNMSWTLFPNPASQNIHLNLKGLNEKVAFRILDMNGRQVKNGFINEEINTIDLYALASGVYCIELSLSPNRIERQRFIKQ